MIYAFKKRKSFFEIYQAFLVKRKLFYTETNEALMSFKLSPPLFSTILFITTINLFDWVEYKRECKKFHGTGTDENPWSRDKSV
jgi:hypothetical protein